MATRILKISALLALLIYGFGPFIFWESGLYHCHFTGSTKRTSQIPFGITIIENYNQSALESFLKKNYPDELQHQWVYRGGSASNLTLFYAKMETGRSGPLSSIYSGILNQFVVNASPADVKAFYDTLVEGNSTEIEEQIEQITTKYFNVEPSSP